MVIWVALAPPVAVEKPPLVVAMAIELHARATAAAQALKA
jgi:hypothetical protein